MKKIILFLSFIFVSTFAFSQVAKCKNAIIMLSSAGNGSITPTGINNGSTGYVSLSLSQQQYTCFNVGVNTVTLTATAANGNTSTCVGTITVKDNVKPLAKCKTVSINIQSDTTLSPSIVDDGSSDACGILERTLTPDKFNCSNVGANSVVLKIKDSNGNESTCTTLVYITCDN